MDLRIGPDDAKHGLAQPLAAPPSQGRVFQAERRIHLSDTTVSGRLRFDAIARYLQDVAIDDVEDANAEEPGHAWIVRRSIVDVLSLPVADRFVTLATWAGGVGPSWATRRTRIVGDSGGHIEAEGLWVFFNRSTLRLERLPARFHGIYGEAAAGRRVSGKLVLPAQPTTDAEHIDWPLRVTDIDILGHVNNAAYWEAIENVIAMDDVRFEQCRAVMEFREEIGLEDRVTLAVARNRSSIGVWFIVDGVVAATAAVSIPGSERNQL